MGEKHPSTQTKRPERPEAKAGLGVLVCWIAGGRKAKGRRQRASASVRVRRAGLRVSTSTGKLAG